MVSEIVKGAAVVTLGGIANATLEYATGKVAKQAIPVGKVGLGVTDAVGAIAALAEIGLGAATKKPGLALFGAGGLAATISMIVASYYMAYNPLNARAQAQVANIPRIESAGIPMAGKMTGTIPANTYSCQTFMV